MCMPPATQHLRVDAAPYAPCPPLHLLPRRQQQLLGRLPPLQLLAALCRGSSGCLLRCRQLRAAVGQLALHTAQLLLKLLQVSEWGGGGEG